MSKKVLFIMSIVVLGFAASTLVVGDPFSKTQEGIMRDEVLSESQHIDAAIEAYLEEKESNNVFRSAGSFFVCKVHSIWENPVLSNENEKVVLVAQACLSMVVPASGGVQEEGGMGLGRGLFKLKHDGKKWVVVDRDERLFPHVEETEKSWVLESENILPQESMDVLDSYNSTIYTEIAAEARRYFYAER